MIRHLIFDLDDTLLDTTSVLLPIANTPEFEKRIQEELPLLPGAIENLKSLKGRYRLFLLTQGRSQFQQAKIKSLGIESFFERIYFVDPSKGESKTQAFRRMCEDMGAPPDTFLSIGNRRSTDIREAKSCGMQTCLFSYGEHSDETVECDADIPDFEVHHHKELIPVCKL